SPHECLNFNKQHDMHWRIEVSISLFVAYIYESQ
ncbi:unnamed protein product, partial [Rotaria sordida]